MSQDSTLKKSTNIYILLYYVIIIDIMHNFAYTLITYENYELG